MSSQTKLGELVPVGGGDPIPLTRELVTVGRRDSCDICLKFQNVSNTHCELTYHGYWMIRDLNSSNGTKVRGDRIPSRAWKPLQPGDEIAIANHRYVIQYTIQDVGAMEIAMAAKEDIFAQSLMEKAGLEKPKNRDGKS